MHPSQTNSTLRTDSKPRLGTSHIPRIPPQPSRPKSLAELMDRVEQSIGDGDRPFKVWLRVAESTRTDAESFLEKGENESAFVSFSISSRIVLEKIPTHPDYRVLLDPTQRHNLKLVSLYTKLRPRSCYSGFPCSGVCRRRQTMRAVGASGDGHHLIYL
ncbi:hypothetical protein BC834DRAFT_664771 [Gloeopeniophorella convolvens]|nr:hypothetical protein BC834DRAFT_664771 [Gloeopeniophorella convolvens]